MNRQKPGGNIEWATPYGVEYYEGWTANPIQGCQAGCAWKMEDEQVECYAKTIAENVARGAYPNGFAHLNFNEKELDAILKHKAPSGIFIDSMSDLAGLNVPDEWTQRVLDVMRQKPEHIFFVLSKNPEHLPDFDWPANVWLGVSAPPTYMNKKLRMGYDLTSSPGRKEWYHKALSYLVETNAQIKWTSIEPLSDDFSTVLRYFPLDWAVMGAGSKGRVHVQPNEIDFNRTLNQLTISGVPVFFKGNIDPELAERCGGWREEWPYYEPAFKRMAEIEGAKEPKQKTLF